MASPVHKPNGEEHIDYENVVDAIGIDFNLTNLKRERALVVRLDERATWQVEQEVAPFDRGQWKTYGDEAEVSYFGNCVGQLGGFLMRLPPNYMELPVHRHEYSDRVIVVRHGSGTFQDGPTDKRVYDVERGSLVVFPAMTWHTFTSGPEGLSCIDFHNPFFPVDNPYFQTTLESELEREAHPDDYDPTRLERFVSKYRLVEPK